MMGAILGAEIPGIGVEFTGQLLFDGLITGLIYGLLAMGIVLIYRSTRVINFAVGNMGIPGAGLFALLVLNYGFPFWIALALSLLVGTLFGTIIELAVIRRLFDAPRVIVLVATIGVAQLAQAIVVAYPEIEGATGATYPTAIGSAFDVSNSVWPPSLSRIRGPQLVILLVVPVMAICLALFLNRTTFGQTVKASASNAQLARLSGISPKLVSTFVWTVGGFVSTLSVIMLSGNARTITGLTNLGPNTMVRALAAAVLAGMVSFPRAVMAGIAIGVLQSMLQFNYLTETGLIDFVLLIAVLISVYLQSRGGGANEVASFSFAPRIKPIPARLKHKLWVRLLPSIGMGALLIVGIAAPLIATKASQQLAHASIIAFAICAVSVTIVTGWSGQLSLGQMAFAGLGALFASALVRGISVDIGWYENRLLVATLPEVPFVAAIFLAGLFTAGLAALLGTGALRVRGLMLAVSTFAFGLAAEAYFYRRPFFNGGNSTSAPFLRGELWIPQPKNLIGDDGWLIKIDLGSQKAYYYFSLVILVLVLIVVAKLRRSGIGRNTIGVRDNPDTASAYTTSPARTKLAAFATAGGIAGIGGAVLGGLVQSIPFTERFFLSGDSLKLVSIVVIGGLGSLIGPVIGAIYVIGLPTIWPDNDLVPLFTSSIGLLILLLYVRGGLVQIGYGTRDGLLAWADSRLGPDETSYKKEQSAPAALARQSLAGAPALNEDGSALKTTGVSVRFGGVVAVDGVDIVANDGEIVGLIGTNGAGKSTLMNAIGGYVPSVGEVNLFGRSISGMAAHNRARLGLGRTFQAAQLFGELTVRETVQVALEARRRTGYLSTATFMPFATSREKANRSDADEIIDFLGLGRYADAFISDLSTGTRRIVELAGLIALDARMLCLDEPTAGVAQREAEQFGPLLVEIRAELGATMLIIEHDMPLIMAISDRVYCLETGRVIAHGLPNDVRNDPAVVASYLGTDDRAIDRSDS